MPDDGSDHRFKYWAFISYSHADKAWGDWLHRALETYRVPGRLVGTVAPSGERVPARVFPIFRDREELPVSVNLSDNISHALEQSRYLIVVCSPRSAASLWVNEEIKTFKRLGKEDRVLALIVAGEPNASEGGGKVGFQARDECFPQALRYRWGTGGELSDERTEPIAADARPDKDGKRNAKLKLLAGLLQVNYDQLRQREHERRVRQLSYLAAAALALLAVFAGLAVYSELQRRKAVAQETEANRQRGIADEQRRTAESETRRARLALARSYFKEGENLIAGQDPEKAVAYLAQAARLDPASRITRARLLRYLMREPFPVHLLLHEGDVTSACFSPDGAKILTTSYDQTARLWDAATGQPLGHPLTLDGWGFAGEFSPGGGKVATLSNGERKHVRVWDTATGRQVGETYNYDAGYPERFQIFSPKGDAVLAGDEGPEVYDWTTGRRLAGPFLADFVQSVRFSPDGTKLAFGYGRVDRTGHAKVVDLRTGNKIFGPERYPGSVFTVRFSPDGKRLLLGYYDEKARYRSSFQVLDTTTYAPLSEPLVVEDDVCDAEFSPDGKMIAVGQGREGGPGLARLWYASTMNPATEPLPQPAAVQAMRFSPDGTRLAVATADGSVRLWDVDSGEVLTPLLRQRLSVNSIAFSPDGTRLVAASNDGTAAVWDAAESSLAAETVVLGKLTRPSLSPDGRMVVGVSGTQARLFSTDSGKEIGRLVGHEKEIKAVRFDGGGTRIATVSDDGTARLWDAATGKALAVPPMRLTAAGALVRFSPDGSRLLTQTADDVAQLWDPATGRAAGERLPCEGPFSWVGYGDGGAVLVTCCRPPKSGIVGSVMHFWQGITGQPVTPPFPNEYIAGERPLSPDGRYCLTVADGKTVRVRATADGHRVLDLAPAGRDVDWTEYAPDGSSFVVVADGKATRYDAATGRVLGQPLTQKETILRAVFSPDGRLLVTTSGRNRDNQVVIREAGTGKPLIEPLEVEGRPWNVAFSPDGATLVAATDDKKYFWDAATGRPLVEPEEIIGAGSLREFAFSRDGSRLLTGLGSVEGDATLRTLPVAAEPLPEWFLALEEAAAGWRLNADGIPETVDRRTVYAMRDDVLAKPDTGFAVHAARQFLGAYKTPLAPPSAKTE